jgi:hypothetical protein
VKGLGGAKLLREILFRIYAVGELSLWQSGTLLFNLLYFSIVCGFSTRKNHIRKLGKYYAAVRPELVEGQAKNAAL